MGKLRRRWTGRGFGHRRRRRQPTTPGTPRPKLRRDADNDRAIPVAGWRWAAHRRAILNHGHAARERANEWLDTDGSVHFSPLLRHGWRGLCGDDIDAVL